MPNFIEIEGTLLTDGQQMGRWIHGRTFLRPALLGPLCQSRPNKYVDIAQSTGAMAESPSFSHISTPFILKFVNISTTLNGLMCLSLRN